jgi:NADH-quinone oxidoreductase subunit A
MTVPLLDNNPLWPLAVYFFAIVVIVAAMIGLSYVLGQRHRERATAEPYESGVASTGTARVRFDIKFYLVAVFFLIFDLEAAFLYAWAVAVRETGWSGYAGVLVFTGVLAAALAYLWRLGALDWGNQRPTRGQGDRGTRGRGER